MKDVLGFENICVTKDVNGVYEAEICLAFVFSIICSTLSVVTEYSSRSLFTLRFLEIPYFSSSMDYNEGLRQFTSGYIIYPFS